MTGIISYGFYIPEYRIKLREIAEMWKKDPQTISDSLGVTQKAVASVDEDALTMAFESASMALSKLSIQPKDIGGVFVGSESHPYSVNPTSTILAEFLGIEGDYLAFDTQFACKAATGAMIAARALVETGFSKYSLVVASDKATGKPHDALEYTAGAGSAAWIIGSGKDVAVEIVQARSFSSDTPDFWRREGIRYPSHGGRFTGKPSYFYHVQSASERLMKQVNMKPKDFTHAVFHMPNGKFPRQIATILGFTQTQLKHSLVVETIGNSYTASALMGLVATLEVSKPGDTIFFCSYGSGAGSDAMILRVTENIDKIRVPFKSKVSGGIQLDYKNYLAYMGAIIE